VDIVYINGDIYHILKFQVPVDMRFGKFHCNNIECKGSQSSDDHLHYRKATAATNKERTLHSPKRGSGSTEIDVLEGVASLAATSGF
jgi:hypothetical protein